MTKLDEIKEKLQYAYHDGERVKNLYKKGEEYKMITYEPINTQIVFRGGHIELIHYNTPLKVPNHVIIDPDMISSEFTFKEVETALSTRKFQLDENGVAVPVRDGATLRALIQSMERSSKRAKHNFFNYALSNNWNYFATFTFADRDVRISKDMIYSAWRDFCSPLKRKYPTFRALGVYEAFKDEESGFHLHCLLGGCRLNLVPATYKNELEGAFLYSEYGNQIFNCSDWKKGFNTVVCIDPRSHQLQVVNYMSKYMQKNSPAPYGCKRFFHTNNLECSENYLYFLPNEEVDELISLLGLSRKPDRAMDREDRKRIENLSEELKVRSEILDWAKRNGIDIGDPVSDSMKRPVCRSRDVVYYVD